MQIRVLYFALARETAGATEACLDLPEGATVADAFAELARRTPALVGVLAGCRAAVDEEFVPHASRLAEGQTLAILPPVSGG